VNLSDANAKCAAAQCAHPELCPLSEVREMGFCEDQQIKLVSQQANVICQVCNVRLGISSRLAKTIMVEQLPVQKKVA
jgi:hypothetical protein